MPKENHGMGTIVKDDFEIIRSISRNHNKREGRKKIPGG